VSLSFQWIGILSVALHPFFFALQKRISAAVLDNGKADDSKCPARKKQKTTGRAPIATRKKISGAGKEKAATMAPARPNTIAAAAKGKAATAAPVAPVSSAAASTTETGALINHGLSDDALTKLKKLKRVELMVELDAFGWPYKSKMNKGDLLNALLLAYADKNSKEKSTVRPSSALLSWNVSNTSPESATGAPQVAALVNAPVGKVASTGSDDEIVFFDCEMEVICDSDKSPLKVHREQNIQGKSLVRMMQPPFLNIVTSF
jgi:hypothetical protein